MWAGQRESLYREGLGVGMVVVGAAAAAAKDGC